MGGLHRCADRRRGRRRRRSEPRAPARARLLQRLPRRRRAEPARAHVPARRRARAGPCARGAPAGAAHATARVPSALLRGLRDGDERAGGRPPSPALPADARGVARRPRPGRRVHRHGLAGPWPDRRDRLAGRGLSGARAHDPAAGGLAALFLPPHRPVLPGDHRSGLRGPAHGRTGVPPQRCVPTARPLGPTGGGGQLAPARPSGGSLVRTAGGGRLHRGHRPARRRHAPGRLDVPLPGLRAGLPRAVVVDRAALGLRRPAPAQRRPTGRGGCPRGARSTTHLAASPPPRPSRPPAPCRATLPPRAARRRQYRSLVRRRTPLGELMTSPSRHLWVTGPHAPSARSLSAVHGLPPALAETSADRRLRGPYSAAGEVVRTVTPWVLRTSPAVASHHDIELVAVAPQLAATLPHRRATLTTLTTPTNRTRFYPGGRTTRLAHGLVEFLRTCARLHHSPRSLVLTDVDDADMTDLEWVGILLRRTDPQTLRVVVHTRGADVPEPLGAALRAFADRHDLPADRSLEPTTQDAATLAAAYVSGDGTSRNPALLAAYEATDPATRAALHDARADELERADRSSLALGAIPYHRERGSDPAGAGAKALLEAIERCVLEGFYDAVIDLAPRCLAVLDWRTRVTDCWLVTAKVTTALTALERPEEAEAYYDQACAATTDPSVHLQSAYGRAMLLPRFYTDARRNHSKAKSWVNTAICISALLPDEQRRAFNLTFNENGLALVEMHLGNLEEALRLVEAGMARLDTQVDPDQHTQHRSVLAYNRAQLLAAMGSLDAALAEYGAVIAEDPHHSEYYFERASVLRRMGRLDEASRDYETAIAESPPYPEPHYNRGDLAAQRG